MDDKPTFRYLLDRLDEVNLLGVRTNAYITTAVDTQKTKTEVERDYTFKKPNLDEHGEPDF